MVLKGIKVVELAGLAPAPLCGMILADFGASVIKVDKIAQSVELDCLANGKQSLALDLKKDQGREIFRRLCKKSDVLIEPFRKGVMESLGLGPNILLADNPRLIYGRLTGYGQNGHLSKRAGHDVNYLSLSGLLSLFGRWKEKPTFPVNTIADFAGGGLTCAFGIILALYNRNATGLGQVVDNSMVEGSMYLGSWLYRSQNLPIWGNQRGKNLLDTGAHFYDTYETKDGKYMSVGALEPQFYAELVEKLELENVSQLDDFENAKKLFTERFLRKTRDEWWEIFKDSDACVAPILTLDEAPLNEHNVEQQSFVRSWEGRPVPAPAPKLSKTPGVSQSTKASPVKGEHNQIILKNLGYTEEEITSFEKDGIISKSLRAHL